VAQIYGSGKRERRGRRATLRSARRTISSIPNEPDFIATVKAYAVIEPILNELIADRPPQPLWGNTLGLMPVEQSAKHNFRTFVMRLNVSGRTGELRLAEGLGLLQQHQIRFVEAVAQVRNRYAHNVTNMHKSLTEILAEEQPHQKRIVEHLTGLKETLPLPVGLDNNILRFMYHRLADYLADALHTLRPPPPPEGGVLSGLFKAAESAPSFAGRVDAEK
jgi:hypothetical protein